MADKGKRSLKDSLIVKVICIILAVSMVIGILLAAIFGIIGLF